MDGDSPFLPTTHLNNEKEEQAGKFDLHDYDMDVINNALTDAHQTEYHDHFGFNVQVKTDDEDSVDSSDQDGSDNDAEHHNTRDSNSPHQSDQQMQSSTMEHERGTEHHKQHLEKTDNGQQNLKATHNDISPTLSSDKVGNNSIVHSIQASLAPKDDTSISAISNHTDSHINAQQDRQHPLSIDNSVPPSPSQQINQSNTYSLCNLNSITSPTSPSRTNYTAIVRRPSQAFQERQSKRTSELDHALSPVRSSSDISSPPSSPSSVSKRMSHSSSATSGTNNPSYGIKQPLQETASIQQETPKQMKLRQDALEVLVQEKKAQPGEYDWDFWHSMVMDTEKVMTTQRSALKGHISTGVPDRLRGYLWQLIAKSKNQAGDLETTYWEHLNDETSVYDKLIQHDLDTSFPMAKFFPFQTDTVDEDGNIKPSQQYQSLFHVLKAYSLFDQDVGYSQGLSFIVAVLLKQIPDEVEVFCLLVQLMGRYGLQGHLTDSMDTLQLHLYQFDHLFQLSLPELHRHVDSLGIKPSMYASRWMATCFAYHCSPSLAVRVLDLILVEGVYVMQRFILALLKKNQPTMMNLGFQELMNFFQVDLFDVYKGQRNEFVIDMYQIKISPKLYSRLAKQYQHELARKMKSQKELKDEARMVNDRLSVQLQEIQDKYKALEMEHHEMTQQAVQTKMAMAKTGSDNELLVHQIKQLQTSCEHMERQKDTERQSGLEDVYRNNTQLIQHNTSLQDQLSEMETVLINLKMNFAERESEYQQLRGQLLDAQKS
ncbi:rab-GTPase-TBC domain-domain-containing protein [Absidia repens]|uniref:Rab-GTPase-TBC domain-domain-containing protein n=1 Tax=Absidia repens TaxID=90262 RepID=A0A1X2J0V9_9FUNG|nr:rab-GTPase-TBC domain-domain-containing protein [Absidia repens]